LRLGVKQRVYHAILSVVWAIEQIPGGYKVRDANGQALAYVYARQTQQQVDAAKVLTFDEARRIAVNVARLPELSGSK
jgi:hypothetical protein